MAKQEVVQVKLEVSASQASAQLTALQGEAKRLSDELKGLTRGTAEYVAANKRLKEVETEMQSLRQSIGTAGLTIRQLQTEAAKLNREIKDLSPGTEQFVDKSKRLNEVNDRLKQLRGQAGQAQQAITGMGRGGDAVMQMLKSRVGGAAGEFGNLTEAILGSGGAIAALGIGAAVLAFQALSKWLLATEEGGDKAAEATSAYNAVLAQTSRDVLKAFDEKPVQSWTKTIAAAINPMVQLALVWDYFTKNSDKLSKAAEEGQKIAQGFDALADKQIALIPKLAELDRDVTALVQKARNTTLEDAKRLAFLDEATKKEKEALALRTTLAQQELALIIRKNEAERLSGELTEEARRKEAEARAKIFSLQEESLALTEKINNRRDSIEEQIAAKEEARRKKQEEADKKAQAELEKLIAERKKIYEKAIADELAAQEAKVEAEIAAITNQYDRERALAAKEADDQIDAVLKSLATEKAKADAIVAIRLAMYERIAQIANNQQLDEEQKQKELERKRKERERRIREAVAETALFEAKISGDRIDVKKAELAQLDVLMKSELEKEEITKEEILAIRKKYELKKMELEKKYSDEEKQWEAKRDNDRINSAVQTANTLLTLSDVLARNEQGRLERQKQKRIAVLDDELKKKRISQEAYDLERAKVEQEVQAQQEQAAREAADLQKAIAIFNILASLEQEIAGYFTAYAAIPGGPTIATGLSTAAAIRAAIATAAVASQEYEQGGVVQVGPGGYQVNGSRHRDGGIHLYDAGQGRWLGAEIEGGEQLYVMRRDMPAVTRQYLQLAMASQSGRVQYATGGVVQVAPPPASSTSTTSTTVVDMAPVIDSLNEVKKAVENLDGRVYVSLTDIEDRQAELKRMRANARI